MYKPEKSLIRFSKLDKKRIKALSDELYDGNFTAACTDPAIEKYHKVFPNGHEDVDIV